MPFSTLSHLECPACGRSHDCEQVAGACACGSPLLARYDLERAAATLTLEDLTGRAQTPWRYHELLPVRDPANVVSLGEQPTPIVTLARYGASIGVPRLSMKDEGRLPTGTFKARGAMVGLSRAAELGVTGFAMPTNGNAGSAWSSYAARAGLKAVVVMPRAAPRITRSECEAAGAEVHQVDGHIGDAGRVAREHVAASGGGLMDASTLREPYRIEGKKTIGLEIAEQLGWRWPDVILCPTGGGVGLIAIHKALGELQELGLLRSGPPRLVAVQAAGCAPIVRAFDAGRTESEPWADARTVAFGLTVPKPLGDRLVLAAIAATDGCAVAVADDDILAECAACVRLEGASPCLEGAAALAAARRLRERGWLDETAEVVVVNTGSGLKDAGRP